jgi:hypothetical protein
MCQVPRELEETHTTPIVECEFDGYVILVIADHPVLPGLPVRAANVLDCRALVEGSNLRLMSDT